MASNKATSIGWLKSNSFAAALSTVVAMTASGGFDACCLTDEGCNNVCTDGGVYARSRQGMQMDVTMMLQCNVYLLAWCLHMEQILVNDGWQGGGGTQAYTVSWLIL